MLPPLNDTTIISKENVTKTLVIIGLCFLFTTVFTGSAAAETLTVTENDTIQGVVDNASAGDTVKIPDGTYETSITIDKDITLSGSENTIIDGTDVYSDSGIFVTAQTATIEGLNIQSFEENAIVYDPPSVGNNLVLNVRDTAMANNDADAIRLRADNTEAIVNIDNIEARNNGEAIYLESPVGDLTVKNSEIISNYRGISGNPTKLVVEETTVNRNTDSGIAVYGSKSVSISDSTISQNEESNIYLSELRADSQISITSVDASRSGDENGIVIESPQSEVTISDVETRSNDHYGNSINAESVTFENVNSNGNGNDGVYINAQTSEVSDYTASNNGDSLVVEGSETTISNVQATSINGENGVHAIGLDSVSIEDSTFTGAGESNILIESSSSEESISLTNVNASQSTGNEGVHIESSDSSEITVTDASLTGNSDNGISVQGGTIELNNVDASDNTDIGVWSSGSDISISGLTATGNSIGVWFGEVGTSGSITDSTIYSNSNVDIKNDAELNVEVSDSTVGILGEVDDEYFEGKVVAGSNVETKNPDLESGLAADFTIDPSTPQAESTVTFDASPTRILGGAEATYEWDLNDDGSVEANGKLADSEYEEGTQAVTLTVTDSEGREDSVTKEFEVSPTGVNAQITTTKTELPADEQTAIEYSITNFLTNEETEVQMVVEYPSGIQVSSTRGLDESSNQATLTETIEPGGQESFRVNINPNSPGQYDVKAIASYQTTGGSDSGRVEETTTFTVSEGESSENSGGNDNSDNDNRNDNNEEGDDDSGGGFLSILGGVFVLYIVYRIVT